MLIAKKVHVRVIMWKALPEFNKIIAEHLQHAWGEFPVFTQNPLLRTIPRKHLMQKKVLLSKLKLC